MPVPTYEEAREVISPIREAKLIRAFDLAWQDWETCPVRGKFSRWPRTRANMLFERLADRMVEQFSDDGGVRFVFEDETVKIVFDERIVGRVKKANANGLGDNIQTTAVLQFVEAQADIPGLEGLRKLEFVYVLNTLQTAIEGVMAQARDGDLFLYRYRINAAGGGQNILPFGPPGGPTRPVPDSGHDAAGLVRPRAPGKRAEEPKSE